METINTLIVGFGPRARQGKDTAANAIHAAYPRETKIYGFADALYSLCRIMGMRGKDGRMLQNVGETFRHPGCMLVGDELVSTHRNFWVEILVDRIATEKPAVALITDMRHLNEAAICEARVKVERFHADGSPWLVTDRDPNHISETALAAYTGWTHQLRNVDGQREAFETAALSMYQELRTASGVAS